MTRAASLRRPASRACRCRPCQRPSATWSARPSASCSGALVMASSPPSTARTSAVAPARSSACSTGSWASSTARPMMPAWRPIPAGWCCASRPSWGRIGWCPPWAACSRAASVSTSSLSSSTQARHVACWSGGSAGRSSPSVATRPPRPIAMSWGRFRWVSSSRATIRSPRQARRASRTLPSTRRPVPRHRPVQRVPLRHVPKARPCG